VDQTTVNEICCPFCEGGKCCFCDYTGRVPIGERHIIKSFEHSKSAGVQLLKQEDPGEIWPEMWDYFINGKATTKK
jgi:hypothetical protein